MKSKTNIEESSEAQKLRRKTLVWRDHWSLFKMFFPVASASAIFVVGAFAAQLHSQGIKLTDRALPMAGLFLVILATPQLVLGVHLTVAFFSRLHLVLNVAGTELVTGTPLISKPVAWNLIDQVRIEEAGGGFQKLTVRYRKHRRSERTRERAIFLTLEQAAAVRLGLNDLNQIAKLHESPIPTE